VSEIGEAIALASGKKTATEVKIAAYRKSLAAYKAAAAEHETRLLAEEKALIAAVEGDKNLLTTVEAEIAELNARGATSVDGQIHYTWRFQFGWMQPHEAIGEIILSPNGQFTAGVDFGLSDERGKMGELKGIAALWRLHVPYEWCLGGQEKVYRKQFAAGELRAAIGVLVDLIETAYETTIPGLQFYVCWKDRSVRPMRASPVCATCDEAGELLFPKGPLPKGKAAVNIVAVMEGRGLEEIVARAADAAVVGAPPPVLAQAPPEDEEDEDDEEDNAVVCEGCRGNVDAQEVFTNLAGAAFCEGCYDDRYTHCSQCEVELEVGNTVECRECDLHYCNYTCLGRAHEA